MTLAYVSVGSNQGERQATCLAAVAALAALPSVRAWRRSGLYLTEPWGLRDQPEFVNLVVELDTDREPRALLADLQAVERALGRVRPAGAPRLGPRAIDLDLLLHGATCLDGPGLVLPHPRLHLRRFVLAPLCELAPGLRHPLLGLAIRELLARLGDGGGWARPLEAPDGGARRDP